MAAEDEESEWNSSKIKGFSFGDDDETPWEELAKYQTISSASGGGTDKNELVISFDQSVAGPGIVVSDKVKAASRLYNQSFLSDEGLSISDAVSSGASGYTDYLPTDLKELRSELLSARKALSKLEVTRFTPLHPKETVQNIFLGRRVALEFYKTFKDKTDLLDEALLFNDGDAILTVTLFIRKTLSKSKFLELLSTRPTAVRHLANYLETRLEISDVTDLLTSLGQHEKAAIVHYKQACNVHSLEARTRRIKGVLQSHFHGHPDANLLIQHLHLLERIAPVIEADKLNPEIANAPVYPELDPGNESVLRTLLYFCLHHWGAGENLLHSPAALRKLHALTERQYTWVALRARAVRGNWKDCEGLVLTKGWLGGKKAKAAVSLDGVVRLLHSSGAPADVLQTYLALMDDAEDRESLARKCGVPNVVIDCLVAQRDRSALQGYKHRLNPQSPEWFYADHALNTSNTKWKN